MCEWIRRKLRDWLLREPKEPVTSWCLLRDGSGYRDRFGYVENWPDGARLNGMWVMWMSLSYHLGLVVKGGDLGEELEALYEALRKHRQTVKEVRGLPLCDD